MIKLPIKIIELIFLLVLTGLANWLYITNMKTSVQIEKVAKMQYPSDWSLHLVADTGFSIIQKNQKFGLDISLKPCDIPCDIVSLSEDIQKDRLNSVLAGVIVTKIMADPSPLKIIQHNGCTIYYQNNYFVSLKLGPVSDVLAIVECGKEHIVFEGLALMPLPSAEKIFFDILNSIEKIDEPSDQSEP